MATRAGYKQRYSSNTNQAASSYRGSSMNTATGRYSGATQTLGDGREGKLTSRRKRYYDVRVGLGLSGG